MSEYEKEVDRVWIGVNPGAYNRERALKQHLEREEESKKRQEEEAKKTRLAAEESAEEARRQSQLLEDQRRRTEEMAADARRHSDWIEDEAHRTRQAPETLFGLTEQRAHVMAACNRILADSLAEPDISVAIDEVAPFFSTLFRLDSSYLDKQSDKRLLRDLRAEFQPVEEQVYATRAARRVDWLLNEAPFMVVACRTLITPDARKTDQEVRQVRDGLEAFCNKLFSTWHLHGARLVDLDKVEPLRTDFKELVTAVNNAQWWQIRCEEEGAVANATQKFAPLQPFTPKQIQDYFYGIEQLSKLKQRHAGIESNRVLGWIVLVLSAGWALLMGEFQASIVLAVICGLAIVVVSQMAKSAKVRYRALQKALITMYPLRKADELRRLRIQVEWEGNGWVVPEKTLLGMMNLKKVQIPVPD